MNSLEELLPRIPRSRRTSARDSQRSKVYAAENEVFSRHSDERPNKVIPEKEVSYWVKNIVASKWWKARVVDDGFRRSQPDVSFATRGGGAWAGHGEMRFCPDARRRWIVLHELAHHATYPSDPGHGWKFCKAYLKLVRKWLGVEWETKLKASFKKHRVRYTQPRTRTLTPEQKAAAVQRLATARAARQVDKGRFGVRHTSSERWVADTTNTRWLMFGELASVKVWTTRQGAERFVTKRSTLTGDLDASAVEVVDLDAMD